MERLTLNSNLGYCASTCAIFSEFMRQQAGVRAFSLGGRPRPGIIQAVGGVKGSEQQDWSLIYRGAQTVLLGSALSVATAELTPEEIRTLREYSEYPLIRASDGSVNLRDGIRMGDAGQTPLQFVYEEADCRLLYTAQMVADVTSIWMTVADSAFGLGPDMCIARNTSNPVAVGGSTPPWDGNRTRGERRGLLETKRKRDLRDVDFAALERSVTEVHTDPRRFKKYGGAFVGR